MKVKWTSALALLTVVPGAVAFLLPHPHRAPRLAPLPLPLRAVPLELEGQLDPAKSWEVTLTFEGETKKATISEDTCVLDAAQQIWPDAPSSCRNGMCTTCAALLVDGKDSAKEAIHGLSPEQSAKGYLLTCQTYVTGPGLHIELGKYDEVYEQQYGRFEKKSQEPEKKKMFKLF